jgi:hypothetical protein
MIAGGRDMQRQPTHPRPRTARTPDQIAFDAFRVALHAFAEAPAVERFRALQRVGRTLDAARAARAASEPGGTTHRVHGR